MFVDLNLTTPNAEVLGIEYTVTDGEGNNTVSDTFDHVVATDVTTNDPDATAGDDLVVTIEHADSADNARFSLYSDEYDVSLINLDDGNPAVTATSTATGTEYTVDLSSLDIPIGDWSVFAAAENASDPFGPVTDTSNHVDTDVTVNGLEVTDFSGPRVAANGTEVAFDVTVENTGNNSITQDVEVVASNNGTATDVDLDLQNPFTRVGTESVTVASGANTTETLTFNTGDLANASELVREYEIAGYTDGSPFSASDSSLFTVGSDSPGAVEVTVTDDLDSQNETTDVALYTLADFNTGGAPFAVKTTDQPDGTVNFRDLAVGSSSANPVTYVAVAAFNDPNFESTTTELDLFEASQTSTSDTVFISRILNADRLSIDSFDPSDTVDTGDTIDINTLVETEDFAAPGFDPLEDAEVNVTDITTVSGPATIDNISEGDTVLSDTNGIATFEDISTVEDFEDVEEDTIFEITFQAEDAGNSPDADVTATATIRFVAEPPSGDGTISGTVDEIREDIELGAQAGHTNIEPSTGTNVHAVQADRLLDNTITGDFEAKASGELSAAQTFTSALTVGNGQSEFARTIVWNTTSQEVVEVLDVQTDYLYFPGDVSLTQNLSIAGTGFNVEDTNGNGGTYGVAVLEPDSELADDHTYAVQVSPDANFTDGDETEAPFVAPNNLTYAGTEDRYSNVPAEPTDVTNSQGDFELLNLFTDGANGLPYYVIAGDGNAGLGFANGAGYDRVFVEQNPEEFQFDDQLEVDLSVQAVDIQADAVDVVNFGEHPPLSETGGAPDTSQIAPFADMSDDTRQRIPRDGSVDVISLETFVEEDGTVVGDEVTVSIDVTEGTFDGEFLPIALGANVLDRGPDNQTITLDTSAEFDDGTVAAGDGNAFVLLESDDAGGVGDDANVTITADLENAAGEAATDFTNKTFFGVLEEDYQSASITGVVADENDNPVDAQIWVSEIQDPQNGITITFQPDSVSDLDNFTATVTDTSTGNVVETVDLTAAQMRDFTFQGFSSSLAPANTDTTFELLADRFDDRTTLSPVPALEAPTSSDRLSYSLTGVARTDQTGTSVSTPVEVNRTSTASIVIVGVDEPLFEMSNLDPEDATIQQGDDLTVSANVTNVGGLTGTQDVVLSIEDENGTVTELGSTAVELDASEEATVEFTLEDVGLDAGNYTHTMSSDDDSVSGSLTVEEGGSGVPAGYVDDNGDTTTPLLQQAIDDWRAGDVDTDTLQIVIDNWRSS